MQTRDRHRKGRRSTLRGVALSCALASLSTCAPFSAIDPPSEDGGVGPKPTDAGADAAPRLDGEAPQGFRCASAPSALFCADFEDETWRDTTAGFQTLPRGITTTTPARLDGKGRALLLSGAANGQIEAWAIRPLGRNPCAVARCRLTFAFQLRSGTLSAATIGSVWRTDGAGQQIRGVRVEGNQLHWVVDYTTQQSPTIAMNDAWRRVRIELDPQASTSTGWIDDVQLASTSYTPARTYTDLRIGVMLNSAFGAMEILFDDVLVESY